MRPKGHIKNLSRNGSLPKMSGQLSTVNCGFGSCFAVNGGVNTVVSRIGVGITITSPLPTHNAYEKLKIVRKFGSSAQMVLLAGCANGR